MILGAFACGVGGAKKAFGGFGVFGGNKKLFDIWALVPLPAGLGVPRRRLEGLERLEGLAAGKWQA